jgi:hypothetical protein
LRHRTQLVACVLALAAGLAVVLPESANPRTPPRHPAAALATTTGSTFDPAPPGSIVATLTGPQAISINPQRAPDRVFYTLTLVYQGPPIAGFVETQWTVRAPPLFNTPGADQLLTGNMYNCSPTPPPTPAISCTASFVEAQRTTSVLVGMRPTGQAGTASITGEVATGATASWTTVITRESPPPPPPPPPPVAPEPVPGPPAAPTKTAVETFTAPGEAETQSATIVPAARTTQVALTWPDADSSFDATSFRIVRDGQVVARSPQSVTAKVRPGKLRVSKRRTARSLDVRIKGLRPGRLIYRIVARRLDGRTRVVARVRQSKRG